MKALLRFLILLATAAFLIVLFPVGCLVIGIGYENVFGPETKLPVEGEVSEFFPLLVLTPSNNEVGYDWNVVYFRDLAEYQTEHPDYQFLIPDGLSEHFEDEVGENTQAGTANYEDPSLPFSAALDVKQVDERRQSIELRYRESGDSVNTAWYEAGEKDFRALYHENYFGPGAAMGSLAVGTIAMVALYLGLGAGQFVMVRRHGRAATEQTNGGTEEV